MLMFFYPKENKNIKEKKIKRLLNVFDFVLEFADLFKFFNIQR
jgi:hypothetical protein